MNYGKIIILVASVLLSLKHSCGVDVCQNRVIIVSTAYIRCIQTSVDGWGCPSLQAALEMKEEIDLNDSCIYLVNDDHLNKTFTISVQRLKITSNSGASIRCSPNTETGLFFNSSSSIEINSVKFLNCGHVRSTKNKDLKMSAALYFQASQNIMLKLVDIEHPKGYGAYFEDCMLKIRIEEVNISRNILSGESKSFGGGVMFIKEDSLIPMNVSLSYCNFNTLNSYKPSDSKRFQPFGHGGALSIKIWNSANNIIILKNNNKFENNSAISGGAVYVHVNIESRNNLFTFDGVQFINNRADKSGGGIHIVTNKYPYELNNTFIFRECIFLRNVASEYGGALSQMKTPRTYHKKPTSSDFYRTVLVSCLFHHNSGNLGTAMYLDDVYLLFDAEPGHPLNISQNNGKAGIDSTESDDFAALFAYSTDIFINGQFHCKENFQSAFVLDYSYLHVNASIQFKENRGNRGAAISLYEESEIIIYSNGELKFTNNSALKGGAIYVSYEVAPIQIFNVDGKLSYRCFYHVIDSIGKHVMLFSKNTASKDQGKAIYATTLNYCNISDIENDFELDNNDGMSSINTDPCNLYINQSEWENLYPGKVFKPNITLIDELGNNVSAIVQITLNTKSVYIDQNYERFLVISNNIQQLSFVGKSKEPFTITISIMAGTASHQTIDTNITECIFGYEFNDRSNKCECSQNNKITRCESDHVYMHKDLWVNGNSYKDIHTCPQFYCKCHNTDESQFDCLFKANEQCATNRDQTSNLCSKCISNTSVGFGGNQCKENCKNSYGIIWILSSMIVAIFLVMVLVIKFDVDIYKNYLNSTFYFYQIVSMFFTSVNLNIKPMVLKVQSVFILEGFHIANSRGVCILQHFDELDKLFFNYLFPIFAFAWIGLIFLLGKKVNWFNYKTDNYIHASVFVIVWAYSDLVRVSFKIFKYATISTTKYVFVEADIQYFGNGRHQAYVIIAGLIFLLIFAFPIILMFSYKINPIFPYLIPFFDYYKSYLKDDFISQLFASYYFVSRLLLSTIETFFFTDKLGTQKTVLSCISLIVFILFAAVKPYKEQYDYLNIYDSFILFLLTNVAVLTCASGSLSAENPNIRAQNILLNIILAAPAIWVALNFLYRLYKFIRLHLRHEEDEEEEEEERRALLRENLINEDDSDDENDD